jgi:hypothetical protein
MQDRFSVEQIAAFRRRWLAGESLYALSREAGCDSETLQRRIDPQRAAEKRRIRTKRGLERKPDGALRYLHVDERVPIEDVRRAFAAIPPDTRNLTQRIFGDPIPERSALSQKYGVDAAMGLLQA